jgi:DDE superfamily endonuclease
VDLGPGRRGELRAGADRGARQRRDDPDDAQAAGRRLEAGQALAHQPGPGVCPEKGARDRLIRLAAGHPEWALGFEDETWWSRLAQPALHAWAEPGRPLRLVEQAIAKDDPDPKALACYGLLVRWAESDGGRHEEAWLRFVDGRPVSAITTRFLAWCCAKLQTLGKTALLLVWDNAPWHVSLAVRGWIRDHNRRVKQAGAGVRIVNCYLPIKAPWLNPIEPKWVHGKRRVVEPARLLPAAELIERVCAAFGCDHEAHLAISQDVA